MQKSPWHSDRPETEVYHDNNKCTEGDNIENENWTPGKGKKLRKCAHCKKLQRIELFLSKKSDLAPRPLKFAVCHVPYTAKLKRF